MPTSHGNARYARQLSLPGFGPEQQQRLADAPGCHLRPITGGLHAVLLCDAPAHQVVDACRRSGIQVTALHDYWGGQGEENGIVFGFGCHDDDTLDWAVNEIKYCVSCL